MPVRARAALLGAVLLLSSCGGTQKPAATAKDRCSVDELADAALDFLVAGDSMWAGDTCAPAQGQAPPTDALVTARDRFQRALEAIRDPMLDGACGPGGGALLFPYEEILGAMDEVLGACRSTPGAPSLPEATASLQQALGLSTATYPAAARSP
jgi:hypothetical protein